jgi:YebC/PmpR family DNA-binding regulatory protein
VAGHSHSANIAVRKGKQDAARARRFSKLARYIMIAAKNGGMDPDTNLRLRYAIDAARAVSMPKDNIERAIKKGGGDLEGVNYDEVLYEGYGPNGVAVLCEIVTDNRNRTAPEIRKVFEVHGGKLGATNCVAYLFDRKGMFVVAAAKTTEEQLMEIALEAGADDIQRQGDVFQVTCPVDAFQTVTDALAAAKIETEDRQLTRIPTNTVEIADVDVARTVLKLMEALDEHDDVQTVAANFTIPEAALAVLANE